MKIIQLFISGLICVGALTVLVVSGRSFPAIREKAKVSTNLEVFAGTTDFYEHKKVLENLRQAPLVNTQAKKSQPLSQIKIATINTEAFENKTTGIWEIVNVFEKLEIEFKPQSEELNLLFEKIQSKVKALELLSNGPIVGCRKDGIVEKTISEYESLSFKYMSRQNSAKFLYDNRKLELLADINKKIAGALKQFSKEKGYAIVLDVSKDNPYTIIESDAVDITREFIQFYNDNSAKAKTQ